MKQDCCLIATIPSLNNFSKVENVFKASCIGEVRFNTGVHTVYPVETVLKILKDFSEKYEKKLWIDIKGRQLRVSKWADPLYECVELNHSIEVSYPATISFRNGDTVNITNVDGNKIFVDPLPREALGAGQSVNIVAKHININGYLTEKDKEYLKWCKELGINNIMASFVESYDDLTQILQILPNADIVSKIESLKGIDFIKQTNTLKLMAARDDLYLQTGQNYNMLSHLRTIIEKDKNAICASKIFGSLEKRENPDFSDFADLELMYNMGYRRFMLSDNICNRSFDKVKNAWRQFINE